MADLNNKIDVTEHAFIVLKTVTLTRRIYGAKHIARVIQGFDDKRIIECKHNKLSTFGSGRQKGELYWRQLINQLVERNYLSVKEGEHKGLELASHAHKILNREERFFISDTNECDISDDITDIPFAALRAWRDSLANEKDIPYYCVLSDDMIRILVRKTPWNQDELREKVNSNLKYIDSHLDELINILNHPSSTSEVSFNAIQIVKAFPGVYSRTQIAKILIGESDDRCTGIQNTDLYGILKGHNQKDIITQINKLIKRQILFDIYSKIYCYRVTIDD